MEWLRSLLVDGQGESSRNLAGLIVLGVGALRETGDVWEPYRLVGPDGVGVEPVSAFLKDLQAAGRSAATQRSYGMDLLRWFRFLWAVEVPWNEATRVEARDFCRWIQIADKPVRPHWRQQEEPPQPQGRPPRRLAPGTPNPVTGKPTPGAKYAPATGAHAETVLRGFYEF